MSNFISRAKQAREVNPFHSHPPHRPSYVVCGSGRGWAGLDTCKMNKAIISFDTSLWNVFSSEQHLFLLLIWLGCSSKYSQALSSSAGVMDRRIGRDQWNELMWWKMRSIIPFNLNSFSIYSDWQRLRIGQHLREQYNTNTTVLINNKATDWGLYQRVKVWYLAHTVLSISNNLSYVAYLARPTSRIWKRPDLKVCEASPRARHYHVCLSTARALRGTPSLVKEAEESFKSGNKAYISVRSQDDVRCRAISIMVA